MAHGYFISGILPNQYERIMTATGIGILGNTYLNTFFESYSECVKALAKESTRDALLEEIVTYEDTFSQMRAMPLAKTRSTLMSFVLGLTPTKCCTTRL